MTAKNKIIDLKKEIEQNKIKEESAKIAKGSTPIEFNTYLINSLAETVEMQADYIQRLISVMESYEDRLQRLADEVYKKDRMSEYLDDVESLEEEQH